MELLFFLLFVVDGLVVGVLISNLVTLLFGDKPSARLLKLLLGVGGGIAYSVMCINIGFGYGDLTFGSMFVVFAPIILLIVVAVINYMYKNQDKN